MQAKSVLITLLLLCTVLRATIYYVEIDGADSENRNGLSVAQAWKSLAYACERVGAGPDTIQLGAGIFTAHTTAFPGAGVTITGVDTAKTTVQGGENWPLAGPLPDEIRRNAYLVAIINADSVTISHIHFTSAQTSHRITGGILADFSHGLLLHHLSVTEFRWAGLYLYRCWYGDFHNNLLHNAAVEKDGHQSGNFRTFWLKFSRIYDNVITSDTGGGYGYKAKGHEDVAFFRNHVDTKWGFSFESAFENEFGVEIYDNYLGGAVSVPKLISQDPKTRTEVKKTGYDYTFWIHDNYCTHSWLVEGPRQWMKINNNYVVVADNKRNGRIYQEHGEGSTGPTWIHHNVIVNATRGFVWNHRGKSENMFIYNNIVFCDDAHDSTGPVLTVGADSRNWQFTNNIVICPESRPRSFVRGSAVSASNNIFVNVTGVPQNSNSVGVMPSFQKEGEKPFPWYAPENENAVQVDAGRDVGLPFLGRAPDIGAYEWGEDETKVREVRGDRCFSVRETHYTIFSPMLFDVAGRRIHRLVPRNSTLLLFASPEMHGGFQSIRIHLVGDNYDLQLH